MAKTDNIKWYKILIVENGITTETWYEDSVSVRNIQNLQMLARHQGFKFRILRQNAINGRWFRYFDTGFTF